MSLPPRPRPRVHIVLSDRGWIIEELSNHLVRALPYVSAGDAVDPDADIQYYMTYSARGERVSHCEVALFTHREADAGAAAHFDAAARDVDHAISMSAVTDRLVSQLGVTTRSTISPGVDLGRFRPKLAIAVVGRTYHTGRKGEALVAAVSDVPDIEWHFTGDGWPGPARHVAAEALPDFYRSMDYVLVPATNEGGPMCVLEALASGTPVIASDVGWAAEFPHIAFERGDAASLRAVLERLRAERFALRDSVASMHWDRWTGEHDTLFARLGADIAARGAPLADPASGAAAPAVRSVALVTHGAEDTTLGGPSVRVPRTRAALAALQLDVVHGFNIWQPGDAWRLARQVRRSGRPFVFSPILLDLSEAPFWQADLLRAFRASASAAEAEARIDDAFKCFASGGAPRIDWEPGYRAALHAIDGVAAGMVFLSDHERRLYERLVGRPPAHGHLVRNPVDSACFDEVDPDLFQRAYGLDDYVLCVGRLEHRKNQLMLATALATTDMPLVLVGHEADAEYAALTRRFGGDRLHIAGRLPPGSDMLRSAIAGARVFALPSWAEGAPLAALEAGAAGTRMVLSDRSSEREYFGEHATYCDPASMTSIRESIRAAWNAPVDAGRAAAQRAMVRERYDWSRHARDTRTVYEAAAAVPAPAPATAGDAAARAPTGIVIDITTWANNHATLSGIVRVECAIARALARRTDIAVRFVMFLGPDRFAEIPAAVVSDGTLANYVALLCAGVEVVRAPQTSGILTDLVTVGSSWMQNGAYAAAVVALARRGNLRFSVLMHDLTPHLFPHWYEQGYAQRWSANCRLMLARADRALVYSASTARDVEHFCVDQDLDAVPIVRIRLADEIGDFGDADESPEGASARAFLTDRPFVLAVGGLHIRKNYALLYDVWTMLPDTMRGPPPMLVIVGGLAWNGRDVARAIQEDPRVRDHIRILDGIDDGTLSWLYERCLFTVYPSLYEGWGLPVGESLARGRICLSSNSSSMPEIAPAITDLLPPLDRAAWAARIAHYAGSATARAVREAAIRDAYAVTTWARTTDDVVRALDGRSRTSAADDYLPGAIALCDASGGGRYLDGGWYEPEPWGVWSASRRSILRMRLAIPVEEDLALTIVARAFKPLAESRSFEVAANDMACGTMTILASDAGHQIEQVAMRVRIPKDAVGADGTLSVSLDADDLSRVDTLEPASKDDRELGMGLCAFIVEPVSLAQDALRLLSTRPDFRALVNAAASDDIAQVMATHPGHPAARCDRRPQPMAPFLRIGRPDGEGARSDGGMLALAIGTARLRADSPVRLSISLSCAEVGAAGGASIASFVNGEPMSSIVAGDGWTELVIRVDRELLGRSDPLRLTLASAASGRSPRPDFALTALTLRQRDREAMVRLPAGTTVSLDDSIADADDGGDTLSIAISCEGVVSDSVLMIDSGGLALDAAGSDGAPVRPIGNDDATLVAGIGGPGGARLILSIASLSAWPDRLPNAAMRQQRLAPVDAVAIPLVDRILPHRGWHDIEADGLRWGREGTVGFWIRVGAGIGLSLHAHLIGGSATAGELRVSVDGVSVVVEIEPADAEDEVVLGIRLPIAPREVRFVEVRGVAVRRPCDVQAGSGDDRALSIRILEMSPRAGAEIAGAAMPGDGPAFTAVWTHR